MEMATTWVAKAGASKSLAQNAAAAVRLSMERAWLRGSGFQTSGTLTAPTVGARTHFAMAVTLVAIAAAAVSGSLSTERIRCLGVISAHKR
jgi:hypothetical protein